MANKEILNKESESIFSKIKNWFSNLFGKKTQPIFEEKKENVEFDAQQTSDDNTVQEYKEQSKNLQYEFSNPETVSKQKIEKIRLDLDNGKIGFEDLYQLSDVEIEELNKSYDGLINDVVSKLQEDNNILEGYNRKISKLQNMES